MRLALFEISTVSCSVHPFFEGFTAVGALKRILDALCPYFHLLLTCFPAIFRRQDSSRRPGRIAAPLFSKNRVHGITRHSR